MFCVRSYLYEISIVPLVWRKSAREIMLLSSCEQTLSRTAGNIEGEQERGQDDRKRDCRAAAVSF